MARQVAEQRATIQVDGELPGHVDGLHARDRGKLAVGVSLRMWDQPTGTRTTSTKPANLPVTALAGSGPGCRGRSGPRLRASG